MQVPPPDHNQTGTAVCLAPGLNRIVAPNPSTLTLHGTNTYIIGTEHLTVIDPGPDSAEHLDALLGFMAGRPVARIILTHSHIDHSGLAPALALATGAPLCAFGASDAGLTPVMQEALVRGGLGDQTGIDPTFQPDVLLRHGDRLETDMHPLRVLHTPGHMGNHISLMWGDMGFCGDHIMGWSSTIISPPYGDLGSYMASCDVLLAQNATRLFAGHGAPIDSPNTRIAELVAHRKQRGHDILTACTEPMTARDLAHIVYTDIPPPLIPAATRNVLAHLIDHLGAGELTIDGPLTDTVKFAPAQHKTQEATLS